jgi:hypothetical protein
MDRLRYFVDVTHVNTQTVVKAYGLHWIVEFRGVKTEEDTENQIDAVLKMISTAMNWFKIRYRLSTD